MSDLHARLRTLLFLVPFVYRNRGVPMVELAERLGLSEKQLFKEFDFLMMIGRPPFSPDDLVDIHVDAGKVFVELPSSLDSPPRFTAYEALALACSAQLFSGDDQMGEAALAVRVALDKVLKSLPEDNRKIFDDLSERYLVLSSSAATPHLDCLRQALDEHREVDMTYYTAGRDTISDRTVRPYGLIHRSGVWYLVAWCTERNAERIFRLSRIQSASLTERIFDPPEQIDLSGSLANRMPVPIGASRQVVVRHAPEDARWVEERWGGAHLEKLSDGGVRATLHDASEQFVLSYVASFGGRAQIEKPPELAELLRQEAQSALEFYK